MTVKSAVRNLSLTLPLCLALAGCGGPKAVRGEDVAGLDDQAMSTGLDKRDLQKLLHQNMDALQASAIVKQWQSEKQPTVAVMPLRNETSEHIGGELEALVSDVETILVNAGHVQVVSLERQGQIIEEVRKQYGDAFDPASIARWGKQVGARYVFTGKVFTSDERMSDERRVQYYMFTQVIDTETSVIRFQFKSSLTKAIVK
jgi:penicillin-binding protein activator